MENVKTLGKNDRKMILEHLLALDKSSLHSRYCSTVSTFALEQKVERMDFDKDRFIGILSKDEKSLVGFAEILTLNHHNAELAFTVSPEAQGCGIGKSLLRASILVARNLNCNHVSIMFMADNLKMAGLAESFDFNIYPCYGEEQVEASLNLPPIDLKSKLNFLFGDLADCHIDILADAQKFSDSVSGLQKKWMEDSISPMTMGL